MYNRQSYYAQDLLNKFFCRCYDERMRRRIGNRSMNEFSDMWSVNLLVSVLVVYLTCVFVYFSSEYILPRDI